MTNALANDESPENRDAPPQAEISHHAEILTLLAYNAWLLPIPFAAQDKRVRELSRLLPGRDVIVLNEVFQRRAQKNLLSALAMAYPYTTPMLRHPGPWYRRGRMLFDGGVLILSRWPIIRTERCLYGGLLRGPDAWAAKGISYACINKGGTPYHILATHTQASAEIPFRLACRLLGRNAKSHYTALRARQFERLADFVDDLAIPRSEAVVYAGDMNADALSSPEEVDRMLQTLDAALPGYSAAAWPREGIGSPPTYDPTQNPLCEKGPPAFYDYILWSRRHRAPENAHLMVQRLRALGSWRRYALGRELRDLSDHHAIEASFTFSS
ncbi:MAG: sphingomyelin phosphodiesterase [Deltaproteobacteria bacterium]|nr:sphingomyelin phosphodiesterase [Deltaproteobacteria bacterium]